MPPKLHFLPIVILLLIGQHLLAQDISFSRPQKIPSKVSEYDIIGSTSEGILVRKWGERFQSIEAFDSEDLSLRWSKELPLLDKKDEILQIVPYQKHLLVLFKSRQQKMQRVYVRKLSVSARKIAEDLLLDSLVFNFGSKTFEYEVVWAKNKQYIALLRKNSDFNGLNSIDCVVFDKSLVQVSRSNIAVDPKILLKQFVLSNEGKLFVVHAQTKRTFASNSPQIEQITLSIFDSKQESLAHINLTKGIYLLSDIHADIDNINKKLILGGFYAERSASAMNGYFYASVDLNNYTLQSTHFHPFTDALLDKISSRVSQTKQVIYNLTIKSVLLRSDGGLLLLGEISYTNEQSTNSGSLLNDGFYRDRFMGINYYCNDIVALSINPDGSLDWALALPKEQYSENDAAYFSSFGILNSKNSVHLIFNERINSRANVNQYSISNAGSYVVSRLFNSQQYLLNAAPQYSKQLSYNTLIIPAFNTRNDFVLVKLRLSPSSN